MAEKEKAEIPLLPLNELQEICDRATEGYVWAVGEGSDERGKPLWYVYSSSKKTARRLPVTYRGRKVVSFICPRPRILKGQ